MAEHPGRKRPLADDEPRGRGRVLDLALDHPAEREIADGAVPVPALEACDVLEEPRLAGGVVALERLEPRDPRVPVAQLAALLGVVEMPPENLGIRGGEAERAEPGQPLVTLHAGRTPGRASRAPRRFAVARDRD